MSYQIFTGSVFQFTSVNSVKPKGSTYRVPKRKTHFTMVSVLYFFINGFTNTRYKAQEMELKRIIRSPVMVSDPNEKLLLNKRRSNAPVIPNTIPNNLET